MAFNPFDTFRKNSKPMMAALTIFVMFVFVLSAGGGGADFFDWFARLVGGEDRRGPVLGSIEGDEYRQGDLLAIRQRRAAANAFMLMAISRADVKIEQDLIGKGLDGNAIKDATRAEEARRLWKEYSLYSQLIRQQGIDPLTHSFLRDSYMQIHTQIRRLGLQTNERDNPEEARLYRYMARVLDHDRLKAQFGAQNLYFGQIPNQTDQDALQFTMFLRLADKRGVKYVNEDIKQMILNDTEVALDPATIVEISRRAMREASDRSMSYEKLITAIGDEFRVLTLLKIEQGGNYNNQFNVPAAMTPYEFYEFYRDRCRELTFDVIDVPVETFLSQVTETPSNKELDQYFRKYNQQEYDPARETPGFKLPRRVEVEYIGVDASKPIYRDALPALQAASTIAGGFTATYLGAGVIPGMMEIAAPLLAEPLLAKEDKYEGEQRANLPSSLPFHQTFHGGSIAPAAVILSQFAEFLKDRPFFNVLGAHLATIALEQRLPVSGNLRVTPRDSSIDHPLPLAAFAALFTVPTNPVACVAQAIAADETMTELIEMRDRVLYGARLAGAIGPLGSPLSAVPAAAALPPLPAGVYASQQTARRLATQPQHIAQLDLESFEKKLEELRKDLIPPEPKKEEGATTTPPSPKADPQKVKIANDAARDYIYDWIRTHPGAETGRSALLDKYRLKDDKALAELFKDIKDTPDMDEVVGLFFQPEEPNYEAHRFEPISLRNELDRIDWNRKGFTQFAPFRPRPRDFSKTQYVVWKEANREAKVYDRYDYVKDKDGNIVKSKDGKEVLPPEMQAEVKKAWKMEKARDKAQKAANEFAKAVEDMAQKTLRDSNNPAAFDKGLNDLAGASKFALLGSAIRVAKLKKSEPDVQAGSPSRYDFPTIVNKKILYPLVPTRANPEGGMADQLVELRNKPVGEILVLPNRPKDHFYVCVLAYKEDLNVDSFYKTVFQSTNVPRSVSRTADPLYEQYAMPEANRAFGKDMLEPHQGGNEVQGNRGDERREGQG